MHSWASNFPLPSYATSCYSIVHESFSQAITKIKTKVFIPKVWKFIQLQPVIDSDGLVFDTSNCNKAQFCHSIMNGFICVTKNDTSQVQFWKDLLFIISSIKKHPLELVASPQQGMVFIDLSQK